MGSQVQHLVSVSGGKDSTAVYLMALESGRPFRAVFADVGNEHPETYDYVSRLHERTGGPKVEWVKANFDAEIAAKRLFIARDMRTGRDYSKPGAPSYGRRRRWTNKGKRRALAELHPTGNPFLDLCMWKGRFPSRAAQFCTEELKVVPIGRDVVGPMLKHGPVLQWLGIRAAESVRRSVMPRFNHHESGSMIWRPILGWSEDDVWAMHRKHALLPNPLYAQGSSRVGCWPCHNCRKAEVQLIVENTPWEIDRIAEWERRVGLCSRRGRATFFAPKEKGVPISIREVADWSRGYRDSSGQSELFFSSQHGAGCTSELGVCEIAA